MKIIFSSINSNIKHFLHQELQYLIDIIFKNPNINIDVYIHTYISNEWQYRWHKGIFNVLEKTNSFIKIIYTDDVINKDDLFVIEPASPMIIDIQYIKYLQKIVFEYYKIPHGINIPTYKVLYTRKNDTDRRHLLNTECLKDNFNLIIDSLNISFEEQVHLFSKMSHFVSVESGAHFVNIMFMQPSSKVMNILTRTDFSTIDNRKENYDSWQLRFGTSILISEFNINTKALQRIKCNDGAACGDFDMHNHVCVDERLKSEIVIWLKPKTELIIQHPGYHGFFSYCSMALMQIINYYYNNNSLPENVDMSKIFTMFKNNDNIDISGLFF